MLYISIPLAQEKWYAIKFISTRLRASETMEDNYTDWCGPEVFKQLYSLRSPHVMRRPIMPNRAPVRASSGEGRGRVKSAGLSLVGKTRAGGKFRHARRIAYW